MSDFKIGLFYPTSTSVHFLSPLGKERNPDVYAAATHVEMARAAETAGLDYMFMADSWGGRGPVSTEQGLSDPMLLAPTLAAVLIAASEHIKIVTTLHQAWWHPLHIARIGGNLDALSGGRWAMNAVSGAGFAPELLESVSPIHDHDQLYEAAAESMDIVLQAWHDDGNVDYDGKHYQAHGRLVGPMPVQEPHPVIVSAGASTAGCEFAGRYASIAFMPGRTTADVIADRRAKIQDAAVRAGREDTDVKILLHASVLIADTQADAESLSAELEASVDMRAVYEYLGTVTRISTYDELFAKYTEDQLRDVGLTAGTTKIHGDAEHVARSIRELRESTGCDGLSLSFPLWGPDQVARFRRDVAPLLEDDGVWAPTLGPRTW